MKAQKQIPISACKSENGFIHDYQKLIKEVVIPYQYEVLNDRIDGIEKSHVVANFINAGKALRGEDVGDGFYGMVFQDSDAAKWIESAAYSLINFPDKELEKQVDDLIEKIGGAQDKDGYLNTYFTVKDREKRWKNLLEGHELYCAGHMMEASTAYYEATGKDSLLKIMLRNAEHIYNHFLVEKHAGYPGHPEVELALLKMYSLTGNKHCLALAEHFINVRGVDNHYYEKEAALRDWTVWGSDPHDGNYQQASKPVREQTEATGHSVRAVYLYTGMAALASETDDKELLGACEKLWENITGKRMYLTGGIGSTVNGEAFTVDYDLPNDTAYAETCASVGLMFFASKMLENKVDGKYADVMERAFYNTVLAGMQLDGKRFFYVNPLEIIPGISGVASTHCHTLPQRPSWYTCACCPPNVARLISSFGKYAYAENDSAVFCNMYAQGEVTFSDGMCIECKTGYPYEFTVTFNVTKGGKTLAVHIPEWSRKTTAKLNGTEIKINILNGYVYFAGITDGDILEITLDDTAKRIYASPKVAENSGMVAVQRGPLVYCFEGTDNHSDILSLSLSENSEIKADGFAEKLPAGTVKLTAKGFRTSDNGLLYTDEKPSVTEVTLTAIPYYTWGNRGETQMRVWIPDDHR